MHLFYTPDITTNEYTLPEEESKHCVKVLRLEVGDEIFLIDGKGGFYRCEIIQAQPKRCEVRCVEKTEEYGQRAFRIHIAIAPTKNIERIEWFLEKCTEIGIDEITPLLCDHSERKVIKEERLEKLDASMDTYRGTAVYLKEHMGVIVVVSGITFVQRMALFAATWFVYRAFGLSGTSFFDILFLQAVIAVAVDMLPLPGGMGISETLFLNIFRPVFGSLLLPGMVLSRGLGYYAELLISAAFTVVAQLTIGNEKVREQKKCIKERVEG